MNKEKTVLQELFVQLKLQLGNNKFSQMFDEVYWLAKEQEQIERSYDKGVIDSYFSHETDTPNGKDYYESKYGG